VHVSSTGNASAGQEKMKIDFYYMEEILDTNSLAYMFTEVQLICPFTSVDMSANYREDAMNSLTRESTVLDIQ